MMVVGVVDQFLKKKKNENGLIMKNSVGIQFNKDASGRAKSVTIDLKKHGKELQLFLEKNGAISIEDEFEKKWAEGISGDELVKRVQLHINTLTWKK